MFPPQAYQLLKSYLSRNCMQYCRVRKQDYQLHISSVRILHIHHYCSKPFSFSLFQIIEGLQVKKALPRHLRDVGPVVAADVVHRHRNDGHVLLLRHHRNGIILAVRSPQLLRVSRRITRSPPLHPPVSGTRPWRTSTSTARTAAAPWATTTSTVSPIF